MFVFVVPLLAAAIGELGFLRGLSLPITLVLAYGAGVSFFFGALLVELWCPEINRVGRTYAQFRTEGRTKQYIIQQLRETYMGLRPDRGNHFLQGLIRYVEPLPKEIHDEIHALHDSALTRQRLWQITESLVEFVPDNKEAFWHVQWFAASSRRAKRLVCSSCFAIGALFAVIIVVAQATIVLEAIPAPATKVEAKK